MYNIYTFMHFNMNKRTKEFILAIQDHKPIYGNTNLNAFVTGMKSIEPNFKSRDTLKNDLDENEFSFFINPSGLVYEIYRYKNPNYENNVNGALP